jgi:hypothetical protein
MLDDDLRPIEPLIAIILSCMRWKNAFSRSCIELQRRRPMLLSLVRMVQASAQYR